MGKDNKNNKIITYAFLILLFAVFVLTPILNYRAVGSELLKTYRSLQDDKTKDKPKTLINGIENAWSSNLFLQEK